MNDEKERKMDQDELWAKTFEPYMDSIFPRESNAKRSLSLRKSGSDKKTSNVKKNTDVDDSAEMAKRNEQYLQEGSQITQLYHHTVNEQTQQLTTVFTIVFACVTAFICAMAAYIIIAKVDQANALIPMIVAGFVDLIAGTLIVVLKLISKARDDFFKESLKSEYYGKIITLIKGVRDEEKQAALIKNCINDYFVYIFKEGNEAEYFDKIVGLIDSVKAEDKKVELIKPFVENFVANNTGTGPSSNNSPSVSGTASAEESEATE